MDVQIRVVSATQSCVGVTDRKVQIVSNRPLGRMAKYKLPTWVPSKEDYEHWDEWRRNHRDGLSAEDGERFQSELSLWLALNEHRALAQGLQLGPLAKQPRYTKPQVGTCPRPEDFADYLSWHSNVGWIEYRALTTHFRQCRPCCSKMIQLYSVMTDLWTEQIGEERAKEIAEALDTQPKFLENEYGYVRRR